MKAYIKAMRLLSLSLALAATTFGILAAFRDGSMKSRSPAENALLVVLVTVAGLASQLGANLINDYFEGSFKYTDPGTRTLVFLGRKRSVFDVFVFLSGLAVLGLAGLIGLYLVWQCGWIMLAIGLTGLIGSYSYTGEPVVYKKRGLGAVLSFLLMGPLMLLGAYYPFARHLDWYPVILGLPVSLLVPSLMISNELRDSQRDERLVMGTLTTRIGPRRSLMLYDILMFGSLALSLLYVLTGIYPLAAAAVLGILPLTLKARSCVARMSRLGIPWTNRVHLLMFLFLAAVLYFL